MHAYIYIYIMYTYIHTYIHVHIHTHTSSPSTSTPPYRFWASHPNCQAVASVPGTTSNDIVPEGPKADFLTNQWGSFHEWDAFRDLEMQPVRCGVVVCDGDENCPDWNGCLVTIRSHVTGSYLTG